MPPKVTIAIPNWNGKALLRQCLASLFAVTDYADFEVVVVDNGSEDGSVSMLESEFPQVTVVENERNRGFAKANNQVFGLAKRTDSDYVLMLNNDSKIVDEDWLSTLINVAERDDSIGVVGCRIVEPDGDVHYDGRHFPLSGFAFSAIKQKYEYNRYQGSELDDNYQYIDEVAGAVFLLDVAVIDQIGGLDEAYSPVYYEESDYCVRVWDAGFRIAYTPETQVTHVRHQTSDELDPLRREYIRYRNHIRFVLTNYPLAWLLVGFPFLIMYAGLFFIKQTDDGITLRDEALSRPHHVVAYVVKSYLAVLGDLPKILAMRRHRRDVRTLLK